MLSIIVPCYNEEKNIPLIIERFKVILQQRTDIEVVLVNNGSTDRSAFIFSSELSKCSLKCFKLVNVSVNQGYGYGILSGLNGAIGDVLAWTHADMQTNPHDVLKAFEFWNYTKTQSDQIFIKGKRKNRKLMEAFFTWGMEVITCVVLKVYLSDINAQPKLFSREFYENFLKKEAPYDFSLDLFALYQAKKNGFKILEVPVYFEKRMHGEAKGGGSWKTRIKLIQRTFTYILGLRKRILSVNR